MKTKKTAITIKPLFMWAGGKYSRGYEAKKAVELLIIKAP